MIRVEIDWDDFPQIDIRKDMEVVSPSFVVSKLREAGVPMLVSLSGFPRAQEGKLVRWEDHLKDSLVFEWYNEGEKHA